MKTFELPQNWALTRRDDTWTVLELEEDGCYECGSSYIELACGKTVVEAIRNAHRGVEEKRQREEARRADYEKRKAEGRLTEWERANERLDSLASFAATTWADEILKAIETPLNPGRNVKP